LETSTNINDEDEGNPESYDEYVVEADDFLSDDDSDTDE
jgi:hypothetical protein